MTLIDVLFEIDFYADQYGSSPVASLLKQLASFYSSFHNQHADRYMSIQSAGCVGSVQDETKNDIETSVSD